MIQVCGNCFGQDGSTLYWGTSLAGMCLCVGCWPGAASATSAKIAYLNTGKSFPLFFGGPVRVSLWLRAMGITKSSLVRTMQLDVAVQLHTKARLVQRRQFDAAVLRYWL